MVDNKKITTFHQDIKTLFIDKDRNCMKGSFDLYKYNDVRNNAKKIYASLQNSTNPMPPGRPWSKEKIEKFKEWMDTGMVEGIPSEREAFYKLMNIEGFPEFLPIAKEMAREYLEKAEMIATDPPPALEEFGKLLKLFKFTQKDFDKRLEDMYTFIEKAGKNYSPANDHIYNSREDVIERIRQWAPFNQTDGAWLRNAVKIGPTDEITSILSEILQDELGNGKTELNHSTLYTTLLATCGIHLPKVHQEAYAWDSKFLDSAFSAPTFALCISQFSDMFFPEILGITLMIEWTVLESVPIIKLFKYYGVDSHFYEMHVAIDNASTGHGAKAKRAIELYLDDIRQIGGEEGVQETWKRIWIGFVALWSTGTLATDLKRKIGLKTFGIPTFSDRMIEMISHKALYASRNHNNRKFEGKDLNQWFHEPKEFLEVLANSSYIVKGDPERSPILTHLTTWDGPMYKVFTEDELNLWRDWIRSLGDFAIPPPEFNFNIVTEMKRLIKTLKNNQYGQLGHSHLLTGPNPDKPKEIITKNISWWLEQDDPTWVMKALSCNKNENPMVKPGDPATSPFITRLMSPANKMGSAFANIAISHGPMKSDFPGGAMVYLPESWNWRDIAYKWIEVGCPLDEQSSKSIISQPEDLLNVNLLYAHHTGIIKHHRHGPGCIH